MVRPGAQGFEEFIEAYEAARARDEQADIRQFLPPRNHDLYQTVLRELVRIDLEYGWEHGRPKRLADYQDSFPELFEDPESLGAVASEEYRLRQQAGENPTRLEYERRFGVSLAHQVSARPRAAVRAGRGAPLAGGAPGEEHDATAPGATDEFEAPGDAFPSEAALAYLERRVGDAGDGPAAGLTWPDHPQNTDHARVLEELRGSDPGAAERLAQAATGMPRVGGRFLGFRLRAELGRGAFSRVFLAHQGELGNRFVVLKVGPDLAGESRTLGQLQHTHIVPVYSFHREGLFQAVCMPYFGSTTLAHVLDALRAGGAWPESGNRLVQILRERRAADRPGTGPVEQPVGPAPGPLNALEKLSHVDAVLWLAVRLAEGLAHAHDRGIVHRDLKPANILLTDDGLPMLSDFNLSEDTKLATSASFARIGGTLPYMAPEHLEGFRGGARPVETRSDLYSLGVMLFELLTGRHPFPVRQGPLSAVLGRMISDRLQAPPQLRPWSSGVSPAVEAIVRKCLEPEPGRRYQTADELREDLQRQLERRPLQYAQEPSLWERARKWRYRNRRLLSATTLAALAAVLVLGLGGLLVARGYELRRLDAAVSLQELSEELKTIQFELTTPSTARRQWEDGMARGRQILDRYRVLEASPWQRAARVRALAPEQQERLRQEMGELLLLMAGAAVRQARMAPEAKAPPEAVALGRRLNAAAEDCFLPEACPRALWQQRAELARLAGQADEARRLLDRAAATPLRAARDHYLYLLVSLLSCYPAGEKQLGQSLAFLREAYPTERHDYTWWLVLGNCQAALGQPARAVESYGHGIALRPDAPWAYFNRGVLYLEPLRDFRQACQDFDRFLQLSPHAPEGFYNRALAKYHLGDLAAALADLDQVLGDGSAGPRGYFLRARVRSKLGDAAGAQRDHEEGLRRPPRDEKDWTARGLARLPGDPQAALADFEKALAIDPYYRAALMNKANVLSERLGRTAEAIDVLDAVIAAYPDLVVARSSRGVLRARLGQREAAHRDARESLKRDPRPHIQYQLAGVYALTSRQRPEDRREAFRLLAAALSRGYGFDLLDKDRDLDGLRDQAEFRRLVEAARTIRSPRESNVLE